MTTWKDFYENYDNWAESTILSRISSLQDIGPSAEVIDCANCISEQVAEKIVRKAISMGMTFTPDDIFELNGMVSESLAKEILERYMKTGKPISVTEIQNLDALVSQESIDMTVLYDMQIGLRFTPKQIIELDGYVSETVLTEALRRSNTKVSRDELEELDGIVDEKLLRKIDKKQKTHVFDEDDDWDEYDDSYDYADTSGKKPGLLSQLGALYVASEIDKRIFGDKDKKKKK